MMKRIRSAVLLLAVCAGCSSMGVEPWERDVLAREEAWPPTETRRQRNFRIAFADQPCFTENIKHLVAPGQCPLRITPRVVQRSTAHNTHQ